MCVRWCVFGVCLVCFVCVCDTVLHLPGTHTPSQQPPWQARGQKLLMLSLSPPSLCPPSSLCLSRSSFLSPSLPLPHPHLLCESAKRLLKDSPSSLDAFFSRIPALSSLALAIPSPTCTCSLYLSRSSCPPLPQHTLPGPCGTFHTHATRSHARTHTHIHTHTHTHLARAL